MDAWQQSLAEEEADLQAVAAVAAMTHEQVQQAARVLSARDRAAAYREQRGRLNPVIIPTRSDGWSTPRWMQAEHITGGNPMNQSITSHLPSGSVLSSVVGGNVLDPAPPRQKKEKKPISRCSRCGCWSTPANVLNVKGVYWCRVCCGGFQGPMDEESSGASS